MSVSKFPSKPIIRYPYEDKTTGWDLDSTRSGVIAQKLGMTLDWDEWGRMYPLTILKVVNCHVTAVKTEEKNGYNAVQVCGGEISMKRLNRAKMGFFAAADVPPARTLTEFKVTKNALIPPGTQLCSRHFVAGQKIDVQGTTKGKGFQGVMKRWGFAGGKASHGNSLAHRTVGATGARQDPGKVWKGKKMPGRMGGKKATMRALKIFYIRPKLDEFAVVGSVPGGKGGFVRCTDARSNDFLQPPPFPTFLPKEDEEVPEILLGEMSNPYQWLSEIGEDPEKLKAEMWKVLKSRSELEPEEKEAQEREFERIRRDFGTSFQVKLRLPGITKKRKEAKRSGKPFVSRLAK